jgi:hypothetical protein
MRRVSRKEDQSMPALHLTVYASAKDFNSLDQCDEKIPQCSQCKDAQQECPGSVIGSIFIPAALPSRAGTRRRRAEASMLAAISSIQMKFIGD